MPKRKKKNYDQNNLDLALRELRETENPKIREIARKYDVPKSTLHFKLKNPEHRTSFGPPPVLTEEEESVLELWIKRLMRKGFPLKVENLQRSVSKFLEENPRPNPFKDSYPGNGWVKAFLRRHPDIALRTSEGVTQSSANISEQDIRKWFTEIRQYLEEIGLVHLLDDPSRVFNGDESGFQLCPKTGKVLAVKGTKNVYTVDTNNSKESITVMFTFSGEACPPMVVYNYQRIPQKITDGIPKDWGVGRSENGWMTSELFFEYIGNVFYPYLIKKGVTLPVIYFLDGHKTHLTYNLSKLCKELGIEVIALYPNATRILQPADVAVFRPVKAAWRNTARTWLMNNPNKSITKVNFASILEEALKQSIKPETLINGFKACGLVPFNPDAIDYDKCLGSNKINPTKNHHKSERILTFSQFRQLVGLTKLTQLETYKNLENINEDFQILHKIYKGFTSSPFVSEEDYIQVPNTSVSAQDTVHAATKFDPPVQDRVPHDDLIQISDLTHLNLSPIEANQGISTELEMPTDNLECHKLSQQDFQPNEEFTTALPVSTPVKGNATITPALQEQGTEHFSSDALKMKEERKRVREEKKIKKQNEENVNPIRKKMKKTTNTCKICEKTTKTSNPLCCDMCSSIFHVKCVPQKHQEHVPEDITLDLYVCHICYNVENNNDDDELISLEERNDEENDNTVEDLEANMLFDMYQKSSKY